MDFQALRDKGIRFGIGITAGASAAGLDAAVVRVKGGAPQLAIKLAKYKRFPFSPSLRTRLLSTRKEGTELAALHFELGKFMAEAAQTMRDSANKELLDVDFIAVQGFTIGHASPRGGRKTIGTLSLGEPALIVEQTGLPVISDFRTRDMAAGGQGSLLSPYVDWLLFAREERTVVRLHLGGLARLTVVTPALENVMAFETGPCNIILDDAVQFLTSSNRLLDSDGAVAGKGVVIDEFLEFLLDHPYFQQVPPKTTSREEFSMDNYLRDALGARRDHSLEDLMATLTAAVAFSIIRAYSRFIKPQYQIARIILSGGGAMNKTLRRQIKKGIPEPVHRISDDYKLPHDAYDAMTVAILGNETLLGKPGNAPHATGARAPVILGKISPP